MNAHEVFEALRKNPESFYFIDLRSEIEFEGGHFPNFSCLPILPTEERHLVGLCYREKGQTEAIKLGEELTAPFKEARCLRWTAAPKSSQKLVLTCFRGGLRSQYAQRWLKEKGVEVPIVNGGYKALRQRSLDLLKEPANLLVLTGYTGSHKTHLIRELKENCIDLEDLAQHRGSAFGSLNKKQPAQATFENALAVELFRNQNQIAIVEDESLLIGRVKLPNLVKEQMKTAPIVFLECSLPERIQNIFQEYVLTPILEGLTPSTLCAQLVAQVENLKNRLGNDRTTAIQFQITHAFIKGMEVTGHALWIERLLVDYYDPRYEFALQQQAREVLFRGVYSDCLDFLRERK